MKTRNHSKKSPYYSSLVHMLVVVLSLSATTLIASENLENEHQLILDKIQTGQISENTFKEVDYQESGWSVKAENLKPDQDGLLVDFDDDVDDNEIADLEQQTGLHFSRDWQVENGKRYILRGSAATLKRAQKLLTNHDLIESVEANIYYSLLENEVPTEDEIARFEINKEKPKKPISKMKPNDPMYNSQWHFDMVNAEQAWALTQGEGAIVAVIDTGVSPGKIGNRKSKYKRVPDLKDTVFVKGYNFVRKNADPSDGNGHGTHVAGTIAQSTNNEFGVAGLAGKAKIMPIKVLSDRGFGTIGAIASGIRFAADNGAHIINMSLGGGGYSPSMAKAMKYAHDKGVTIICAAGNAAKAVVEYPAAYPEAISVSALGPDGKLAFYSSHGDGLSIAAPGGDTRVDLNKDGLPDGVLQDTIARGNPKQHGFFPFQGTSMATPHVAGVAALIVARGVNDPDRVKKILLDSAYKMDSKLKYGAGGLDAYAAVKKAGQDSSLLALLMAVSMVFLAGRKNNENILRTSFSASKFRAFSKVFVPIFLTTGGFYFLSGLGTVSNILSTSILSWPSLLLSNLHFNAPFLSVLVVIIPMIILWSFKSLRLLIGGFAFGTAAFLLSRAMFGEINVLWIPGHGILDFAWLSLNAGAAYYLGCLALKK